MKKNQKIKSEKSFSAQGQLLARFSDVPLPAFVFAKFNNRSARGRGGVVLISLMKKNQKLSVSDLMNTTKKQNTSE